MKKRNSYYDVVCNEITACTQKALAYRNPKALANKKGKAYRKLVPRGKVFDRLEKQEWNAFVRLFANTSVKWQQIKT